MAEQQQHEQTVPLKTIARVCNITERRVNQLVKEGVMPRHERGRYPFIRCVTGYIQYLQARVDGSGFKSPDIEESKNRKLAAEAEMAELELAKGRREVMTIADHFKVVNILFDLLRTSLLALPTRLAPNLVTATDVKGIKSTLESDLDGILRELSASVVNSSRNMDRMVGADSGSSQAPDATPKAARRRVGRPRKSAKLGSSSGARKVEDGAS